MSELCGEDSELRHQITDGEHTVPAEGVLESSLSGVEGVAVNGLTDTIRARHDTNAVHEGLPITPELDGSLDDEMTDEEIAKEIAAIPDDFKNGRRSLDYLPPYIQLLILRRRVDRQTRSQDGFERDRPDGRAIVY